MVARISVGTMLAALLSACASSPAQEPTHADAEAGEDQQETEAGGPSTWSEAEPLSVSNNESKRPSKRNGSVRVESDPEKHGSQLNFNFTVNGLPMFVHQGACQFELWTGLKAPLEVMRNAVLEALST